MIKIRKMRFIPLLLILLLVGMMVVPTMSMAAPSTPVKVELGSTSSFAVLAGSTVTNTGSTTITGDAGVDVGVSAGSAITGFPPGVLTGVGTFHSNDALAISAQTALGNAYVDASTRPITQDLSGIDLGGLTLTPGVYYFSSSAGFTGDLTLDGQGLSDPVFIFQIGSTLITADGAPGVPASRVILTNGARYCRTFWQVGSSATLGTYSEFVGHIFAQASITAKTGANVNGQLLARIGAVTLDTNTITNGFCSTPPAPTTSSSGGTESTPTPPLINVIKTPEPLALTSGQGLVTYTYKVTNPGNIQLSDVSVTDDKVSPVRYVSGDVNADNMLQTSETWIYSSKMNLTTTTTNTATAKGSANGMTATDIAFATVVVTDTPIPVYPPLINVIKTPEPLALTSGQGSVTYTYKVFNPGVVALSNVSVTDDKVSPVTYVSGDVNNDNLLQAGEIWIYTATVNLNATTTNTATAKGSANGLTAVDIAYATVVVTPIISPPETPTPKLPQTGSETNVPWLIPVGVFAMMLVLITLPGLKRTKSSSKR